MSSKFIPTCKEDKFIFLEFIFLIFKNTIPFVLECFEIFIVFILFILFFIKYKIKLRLEINFKKLEPIINKEFLYNNSFDKLYQGKY